MFLAFLQAEDVNVFVVDWSAGAGITAPNVAQNTVDSGQYSNYDFYLFIFKEMITNKRNDDPSSYL